MPFERCLRRDECDAVRNVFGCGGVALKQDSPRHGARREEEEKQQPVALAEAGMPDVDACAQEYQRRPGSVSTCMARPGLLDKADALR